MPEDKVVNLGGTIEGFPVQKETGGFNGNNGVPPSLSVNDIYNSIGTRPVGRPSISVNSFYTGDRYETALPGTDTEEMAAQQQPWTDKWINSIGKMGGVMAGAFVSGTAGLIYGLGKAATDGKFSSLYNNDVTQSMDAMNRYLEDALPNYYTAQERDADWWTPDNLFTANFWADKVLKNLGFSAGALAGGFAWSQMFKLMGITNGLVKAGRALELVEETEKAITAVPRLQQLSALDNTLTSLGAKYLKGPAAGILKSSDRILTAAMGTFGEASLEAVQNLNAFRDNLIQEYKAKYGSEPTGAALDEINAYADKVGNFTWGFNTLLLTGTNYIQLPKILGSSRKNEKMLLGDIERDLTKPIGSQWYRPRPGLLDKTKGAASLFFAPTEAFEEGAQFAIQTGTNAYFNRAYENKEDISSFFDNLAGAFTGTVGEGAEKAFTTKEGMESILIGGISGGLQQAVSPQGTIPQQGIFGTTGELGRNTDIAVAALNKTGLKNVLQDQVNYIGRAINSQKLRVEAIANNDVLSEKDFERDYTLSYVMPRVKYGKVDSINDEIDNYVQQSMNDEGFNQLKAEGVIAQDETREQFLQRANSIKEIAKSVDGLYSQINDRYSAYVDKDGKRIFSDDVVDRMVYAASKVKDYDVRIPQVSASLLAAGVNVQSVLEGIITNNEPSVDATRAALDYINGLDILSEDKDTLKRDLQDVMELSLRRKMFINDYEGIRRNPEDYKEVEKVAEKEEPAVVKQQILPEGAKRKKTIDREVEIGKEYSLRKVAKVEDGKLQVAPKLTVLSKTLGGEYEVTLPNGTTTFLKPSDFKQYELTEQEVDEEDLKGIVDEAIDTVLNKKKYSNIAKPTGNKVAYVNALNNPQLLADIEKEVDKRVDEFFGKAADEEATLKDKTVTTELDNTSDVGIQTTDIDAGTFEPDPKKTDQEATDSTVAPVEGYSQKEPLAEHHIRANRFGANYYSFPNRDNFRGIIVTQGNEEKVGVPGLMQWLKNKGRAEAPVDPSTTIAMVIMGVDPITNERYFVGENGEKLEKPTLDTIIYQVFSDNLKWANGESMFRNSTPEDVQDSLRKDYRAWREQTLKNPSIDLYKISASFGTPQYVGELNENGKFIFDNTAKVAVEDSGLITDVDLRTRRVIGVPTTDGAVVYGSSTFNNVKGVPLLYTKNGLVRLRNRNISKSEAGLIYDAIAQLASNLFTDKNLRSNESVMLYNWLKSVIYWGTPKDQQGNRKKAGLSSVFFENGELVMGREEKKFSIKPSALKKNKAAIIAELQKMYNNVNSTLVTGGQKQDWNKPYTEITAITPEGIQTREWKNYQTFLLSNKNPDGSARTAIPLTTRIRPLTGEGDTNRKGIYFTLIDKKGNTSQEVTPEKPQKKVVVPATETEAKKEKPVQKFNLEGEENILPSKLGDIPFTITKDKFIETDGNQGINLPDVNTDPTYNTMLEGAIIKLAGIPNSGITENTPNDDAIAIAEKFLRNIIKAEVKKQLAPAPAVAPAPVVETKANVAPSLQEKINQRKQAGPTKRGSDFRLELAKDLKKFKPENWSKVEAFLKEKYPNIPVYRVKNYILAANGRRAHGMFQDGAIYLSETAEVGTVYHEVFHSVFQALTSPEERANIAAEFRGRSGSFFDRASLKDVKYSEATDKQMEEKLAEEFRDYMQEGKVPQKPAKGGSFISRLFSDIVNFFKTFFTGENAKSNTEALFAKIGSGYFAQATPYDSPLSFAKRGFIDIDEVIGGELADYSLDTFTGEQIHDLMQHMTYIVVRDLFEENKGLFEITKKKKSEEYKKLQDELRDLMADNINEIEKMVVDGEATAAEADILTDHYNNLYENIINNWESIIEKHQEYLRSYNIEFDENDEFDFVSYEKSKDDPYGDSRKIDNMRKTNAAVKLLLASLPVIQSNGSEKLSSIGGYTLIPMSEMFMGVMNNVHTSRSMTEMVNRVKLMADDDPKYIKLYNRLSKLKNIEDLDNAADLQLLSAFWRSFKKQSPTVKTVYVLDNGDIQVGDSNFTTAARQVKDEMLNSIKKAIADGSKYFVKSENGKSYIGNADAIKGDIKIGKDNLDAQVSFLKELNIEFDADRLAITPERTQFAEAVNGIRESIAKAGSIVSIGGRSLSIDKRLRQLSEIKAKMDNPEFSSTYYNVNGELTQTFIGTNAASDLYDMLSQIENLSELAGTQYEYLLTDSFAKNSFLLYKMFDKESGKRIEGTENIMETAYADGTVNEKRGQQKESSKLVYKERLLQEINLNLAGYYLNLIPGDAAIEWMMYMGNAVDKSEILVNYKRAQDIFKGYLEDEIALAKEKRPVAKGKKSNELRFFKNILGEKLQNTVLSFEGTTDELYDQHGADINDAIDAFINLERDRLKATMLEYGALKRDGENFTAEGVAFGKESMTENELNNELASLSINYAINNIELHKLLYSDPYQYSDELKRIKSFNSPRESVINSSSEMNTAYHKVWNSSFAEEDLGYTDFEKDYFRAATIDDVTATVDLKDYGVWEETDGGGIISLKALRNFKIRAGVWDNDQERQYKYDIAWEKQDKGKKKQDKSNKLTNSDRRALKGGNPKVMRTYTPIKPIVSGNKANGRSYNDVVLDKFALYPFSYRILKEINPTSNAIKLYDKMQAENVDYVVFKSGRKVGAEKTFSLYNEKNGDFNDAPFETEEQETDKDLPQTVLNIPFAIMSIQSEVPSKEENEVTRGSQMTKLATLDMMEAGVPIDFMPDKSFKERYDAWYDMDEEQQKKASELYKEIKNNQDILEALVEEGVHNLTNEFGLVKVEEGYRIESLDKVANALRNEITKREVNDNISAALKAYKDGTVILEATPAYQQVRNILYSIADRNVMSPKMSGGMKVQIPSTLLESTRRVKDGVYTSDVLKFYEDKDGKRVCEIMVARWFKSDMSDDELLEELKNSEILKGIGFRIPTQKQNSIDSFVIKRFLPEEFGDAVVIPSALVKKVGSDFDIDKLNVYLKNVDVNKQTGEIRLIPYQGVGDEIRSRFKNRRDYQKSLENGYIESLQKLVSHPLNFENLIKPNSAEQMKGLSRKIVEKLGLGTFDYNVATNMLSRRFMSRLRHALVTGKYAIGIAAVNQTNHSLNQRSPIYIDFNGRKGVLSNQDKKFLGNGEIKFSKYNTIEIDGKTYPTVSMIKDADGQNISDVLGQLIDGYVDISKDTWIMELGLTPNVASTWMFLVKIGVPVETVSYFMNQPIIREYLRNIEKKGSTWLFNEKELKNIERKYKGAAVRVQEIPSNKDLYEMIGKTFTAVPGKQKLSAVEIAEQKFMLREFVKYAKMAQQLFYVTQGTNFDTASFNDPFLIFKKLYQLDKARNTIFSSVDDILKNSFLGKLKDGAIDVRQAISEILLSDRKGNIRETVQDVLISYVDMNDRDFIRTSQRVVATLFDWAMQTQKGWNADIKKILVDKQTNVANKVANFIKSAQSTPIANNHIIKLLTPDFATAEQEVNNLKFKNKPNKMYDQNQIIYGFKELKNYLKSQNNLELYDDLVKLAVLQSGLTQSTISFTTLLPYEDFVGVYNDVLADLPAMSLQAFKDLNVFERTYWNYDDLVPHMEAEYKYTFPDPFPEYNTNMSFTPEVYNAMKSREIPTLLKIPEMSREANNDLIVYTWEKKIKSSEKKAMRERGDYSYIKKGLFKKVGLAGNNFIYKAINAWGDGIYAREFYNIPQESVIENGFIKADESIPDTKIMSYFIGTPITSEEEEREEPVEVITFETAFSPERQEQIITNFATKHNLSKEKAAEQIKEAIDKKGQEVINKLNECY